MTRGNQREKDRERAAARAKASKNKDDGLTPEQRRERDAKALQEKLAKKADKSAGAAGANSSSGDLGDAQSRGRGLSRCGKE